jgi:hypothetical protein
MPSGSTSPDWPGCARGRCAATHNLATDQAREAWPKPPGNRCAWESASLDAFDSSRDVDEFAAAWWPQVDPREVLLRLVDTDDVSRLAGVSSPMTKRPPSR